MVVSSLTVPGTTQQSLELVLQEQSVEVWGHADDMWQSARVPSIADLATFLAAIEAEAAVKPALSARDGQQPSADVVGERPRCAKGASLGSVQLVP